MSAGFSILVDTAAAVVREVPMQREFAVSRAAAEAQQHSAAAAARFANDTPEHLIGRRAAARMTAGYSRG